MLNPRIVDRGTFTIVGVSASGQPGEINYANVWANQFIPMESIIRPLSVDGGSYGISFSSNEQTIYIAGVAVADGVEVPDGLECRVLPSARYAVFDCTLETMADIMQQAYGQWFSKANMQPDSDANIFEYYMPSSSAGEMRVEIYIPVKPADHHNDAKRGEKMGTFDTIRNRRSIRNYKDDPIADEVLRRILQAGILAPSGMNRQPWKFYVVQGDKRVEMIERLKEGLVNRERDGLNVSGARHSFEVMAQAPVTVFIYRFNRAAPWLMDSMEQYYRDLVDVQSVGAAIQNMALTAEELGIGSLWVCDVFSANQEINAWLGESTEMIAALCLGYANERPVARKRRSFEETITYL